MTTMHAPSVILFDWDNTLVDTWPTIHESLNMTLRHMQHPEWSLDTVRKQVKKSMRESFPDMFGDRWETAAAHYQQSYRSIHLHSLQLLPDALATLEAAKEAGLILGVVSNKRGDTLRQEVQHLGLADYFAVLVGAGDAARDKPEADPAFLALEQIRQPAMPSVWFVGDTVVDLGCALAAGLTPILYGDHVVNGMQYDGYAFAAHVHDHAALIELIAAAR